MSESRVDLPSRMPITRNERWTVGANAVAAALGTTLGIFIEGLWFFTSDVAGAGLGIAMMGTSAAIAISVTAVASALVAIPVAYLTYRELMSEAEGLQAQLRTEEIARHEQHEKLFFKLLRLRCLFENQENYSTYITSFLTQKINITSEINVPELLQQIERVYNRHSAQRYSLQFLAQSNAAEHIRSLQSQTFLQLMCDGNLDEDVLRHRLLDEIKDTENLQQHFKTISTPPVTERGMAILYGAAAGMCVSGFVLGGGWAFGALTISAGLCAAVPVAGWAVLVAGCLVMGIAFGWGIGLCKQKNIQRKTLLDQVCTRNELLTTASKAVRDAHSNKYALELTLKQHKEVKKSEKVSERPEVLKESFDEFAVESVRPRMRSM